MALSEQEIIRREKTTILTQLGNQSLSCKPFPNSYFKAGQRTFEDGKK
jgi:hypothetical protein